MKAERTTCATKEIGDMIKAMQVNQIGTAAAAQLNGNAEELQRLVRQFKL